MVGGADKICSYLADGRQTIRVEVIASKAPLSLSGYGLLTKTYSSLFYGADYDATGYGDFHRSIWICPVTLFVLGRYPKYIYVKEEIKSPYESSRGSYVKRSLSMHKGFVGLSKYVDINTL